MFRFTMIHRLLTFDGPKYLPSGESHAETAWPYKPAGIDGSDEITLDYAVWSFHNLIINGHAVHEIIFGICVGPHMYKIYIRCAERRENRSEGEEKHIDQCKEDDNKIRLCLKSGDWFIDNAVWCPNISIVKSLNTIKCNARFESMFVCADKVQRSG